MRRIPRLRHVLTLLTLFLVACGLTRDEGVASEALQPEPVAEPPDFRGYMSFIINVHDIVHTEDSGRAIEKFISIFEKHGVKGEFYFTAPVTRMLVKQAPGAIERIKSTGMTVSYHIRPPHPAYPQFGGPLRGLAMPQQVDLLSQYENHRIDLSTGALDPSKPGGYAYVKEVFGTAPVSTGGVRQDLHSAMAGIWGGQGARMFVAYHEENPTPEAAFAKMGPLLQRPSDFSITQVEVLPGKKTPWWNEVIGPNAASANPSTLLDAKLDAWDQDRLPFVTSLIHENNTYRRGTPWALRYYETTAKKKPLDSPWSEDARDGSKRRLPEKQEAFWARYDAFVGHAAKDMCVLTSKEIVELAAQTGVGPGKAPTTCPTR